MTERTDTIVVAGRASGRLGAPDFAREVHHVHHRYAAEVVGAHGLCPHMARDPRRAFGTFVVVLDLELDVNVAAEAVVSAASPVVHVVFPLVEVDVRTFEEWGQEVHRAVAHVFGARGETAPVHAAFHPAMRGDATSAARLVGLLRQAPDPFLQFVPEGLQAGGTQFIDLSTFDPETFVAPPAPKAFDNFDRLSPHEVDAIRDRIAAIHRERDLRYAPFLEAWTTHRRRAEG
ncbi:MAG: hypothetical protein AAGN82_11975 [Myxococcota bacterium]